MFTYIKKEAICDMCGEPLGTTCGHVTRVFRHFTPDGYPYDKIEDQVSLHVLCRDCLGHIQWYIKNHEVKEGFDYVDEV